MHFSYPIYLCNPAHVGIAPEAFRFDSHDVRQSLINKLISEWSIKKFGIKNYQPKV